jgi:hypothetical protein
MTNKTRKQSDPKPRKTTKREATRHRKCNYTGRTQKGENDLALSVDVRSLGQRIGVVVC